MNDNSVTRILPQWLILRVLEQILGRLFSFGNFFSISASFFVVGQFLSVVNGQIFNRKIYPSGHTDYATHPSSLPSYLGTT